MNFVLFLSTQHQLSMFLVLNLLYISFSVLFNQVCIVTVY